MLDGCGCCKVCARQLFEDCSKSQPCDHTKGLECNFGGGYGSAKGICRGTMTSVLFAVFLMNSLTLSALLFSCQTSLLLLLCSKTAKSDGRTCEYNNKIYQNGEIFRPNCKHQCTCMDGAVGCVSLCPHELALPKLGCAQPRRVKVPGRCCDQLVCPEEAKTEKQKHRKKHSKDRPSEDDLTNRNELAHVWRGESLAGEQF